MKIFFAKLFRKQYILDYFAHFLLIFKRIIPTLDKLLHNWLNIAKVIIFLKIIFISEKLWHFSFSIWIKWLYITLRLKILLLDIKLTRRGVLVLFIWGIEPKILSVCLINDWNWGRWSNVNVLQNIPPSCLFTSLLL